MQHETHMTLYGVPKATETIPSLEIPADSPLQAVLHIIYKRARAARSKTYVESTRASWQPEL